MTEAVWLLWNRALIDYVKAATMWLLVRMHRSETEARPPPAIQAAPDNRDLPNPD
jgi:hypothetical protein